MVRYCLCLALLAVLMNAPLARGQREFGFDNRKSSGQEYLKPEETVRRFQPAPGYEVELFAGEPDLVNPIAFTIDEKGRIWVVECFEYPKRTPEGKKPRDRIKILEDTDGDGRCDKVTVWAEGKDLPTGWDLASGIEVGRGGVFLGAPPYLFFLQDTDGDGKCDKQEVLLKGFGSQDTHETLNTFQWGPDGRLYGLHGVFTQSAIGDVRMNAAVWRYDPGTKNFEVWAEGTSNPWGMDFDPRGQCHLACCVIPHLFHMVPGGRYIRQAGSSVNPYAYGLLPQSCDHTHHKESGWAHAGLLVLEGSHVPEAYQGSVIMGSIHGCSVKRDVLRRAGSTFLAGHAPDFLVSGDKNFRPINLRWGPDGSIYCIDWHDQNPCHQAAADSWDYERGRIYRIHRKDAAPAKATDLSKNSSRELVDLLRDDNPYLYRTALRLLTERRDKGVSPELRRLLSDAKETVALRGLWGLYAVGEFDGAAAGEALKHDSPWVRSWGVRLLGEPGRVPAATLAALTKLAATEKAPEVRLQLASTAQRLKEQDVLPLLHNLMKWDEDADDRFQPLMLWLAYEPQVADKGTPVLDWLRKNAPGNELVTIEIVPRTMRRLVATGRDEDLAACLAFLRSVPDSAVRRQALEGLTVALKDRQVQPPDAWRLAYASLVADGDERVRQLARKLAVNFRDEKAVRLAARVAADRGKSAVERVDAIRDLALAQPGDAVGLLLTVVKDDAAPEPVRAEACRALANFDEGDIAGKVLAGWKSYPQSLKVEAVNLMSSRRPWAEVLLRAVGQKLVDRTQLDNNTILRIRAFRDAELDRLIETVWGQFRETPEQLAKVLAEMGRKIDEGEASFARGRKVFEGTCAKCHKFGGVGHDVGPALDGASREIDYLLINVLDPNRVVGQPYFTRLVELKSGRIESGLLADEGPDSITLKGENAALKVIQRKDIAGEVLVQPKSVMPEGLGENLKVQDLRDLIRYMMAHPFLTNVHVAGPFPADKAPDVKTADPTATEGVRFARLVAPVTGRIELPEAKEPGVAYVVAEVDTPEALQTELLLGANGRVDIWLNGEQVAEGKNSPGEAYPDLATIPVQLRAGRNVLLLTVRYSGTGTVYARLRDPNRQIRHADYGDVEAR